MNMTCNKAAAALWLMAFGLAGCTSESYDSGDNGYSYMRADFAEVHTSGDATVVSAVTDDGDSVGFSNPFKASWASKPDTVYRSLVYYNVARSGDGGRAEFLTGADVPVLSPRKAADFGKVVTDPVGFESLWVSRSGRYLNLGLTLKTGRADSDDAVQTVGMADEGTSVSPDGRRRVSLRLYHNQGGVPEYYSARKFVSIPLSAIAADSITLTVNTYNGEVVRTVSTKQKDDAPKI